MNRRTPTGLGPEPNAFDLARRSSRSNLKKNILVTQSAPDLTRDICAYTDMCSSIIRIRIKSGNNS